MRVLFASLAFAFLAACGGSETTDELNDLTPEAPPPVTEISVEPMDVTGETCGGLAAIECPGTFYCKQDPGECVEFEDGAGTCQPKPEICTREYKPVCGCDFETYSNACEAAAAGISVAAEGECAPIDTN